MRDVNKVKLNGLMNQAATNYVLALKPDESGSYSNVVIARNGVTWQSHEDTKHRPMNRTATVKHEIASSRLYRDSQ